MAETIEYITNTTLIKQLGNIEKVDDATKIIPLMPLGRRDVVKLVGQAKYDEVKVMEDDSAEKKIFALAESYFCLSYIATTINKVSSGSGYTKSTGFQDSRQEMMSEHELQQVKAGYRSEAEGLLGEWRIVNDKDEDDNPDTCNAGHTKMIAI